MRSAPIRNLANTAMTADFSSSGLDLSQIVSCSIQAIWTAEPGDEPVGYLVLEMSNDSVQPTSGADGNTQDPAAAVTNWTTYEITKVNINAQEGNFLWDIMQAGYRWIRVSYVRTSGDGIMVINANVKGV